MAVLKWAAVCLTHCLLCYSACFFFRALEWLCHPRLIESMEEDSFFVVPYATNHVATLHSQISQLQFYLNLSLATPLLVVCFSSLPPFYVRCNRISSYGFHLLGQDQCFRPEYLWQVLSHHYFFRIQEVWQAGGALSAICCRLPTLCELSTLFRNLEGLVLF